MIVVFPESFQFWPVFLCFFIPHTFIRNRILQFHLLKECSLNHTRSSSKRKKNKPKKNESTREIRRNVKCLALKKKRSFKALSWWKLFIFIAIIQSDCIEWRDEWFIHSLTLALLIRSKSFIERNWIIKQTTTTPRSFNTLQPISFHMTSYYAFINYKVSFYIEL